MNKKTFKTILLLCLPSLILAILSNRRPQDRRPIKYFLPYEKVRLNALARYGETEARRAFGPQIVKPPRIGIKGLIRSWLPFGLVLWLDKGASFPIIANSSIPTTSSQSGNTPVASDEMKKRLAGLQQSFDIRQDRLEVLLLRILTSLKRV